MGRQQYLERLALGRSPFQELTAPAESSNENWLEQSTNAATEINGDQSPDQTYNSKGRLINKRTEERNAAMRDAQNAVLELVGVVESRDASDRVEEAWNQSLRKQWERLLDAEQERGDDLNMVLEYLHRLLTWWPEALIARVQAGLYSTSQSFADVLLHDTGRIRALGASVSFAVFLPGIVPHAVCTLADALLCGALVEGIGHLQTHIGKSSNRRRVPKWLRITAMVVSEVLCAAVGVVLMPLEFHAETQRLGLAPTWPLLPHWRAFTPTDSSSSHRFLWTSSIGLPRFRLLGSPGLLLIVLRSMTRYQDEETPIAGQLTPWEYPAANRRAERITPPDVQDEPFAWILYQGYIARWKILRWLGWTLEQTTPFPDSPYQNNTQATQLPVVFAEDRSSDASEWCMWLHGKYRSTSLSMQVTKYLAERIDHLFQKLLLLPLESLVARAVTQSFLTTTLPKTSLALTAAQVAYSPFSGGPLGDIMLHGSNVPAWTAAGSYLSKLGLSLALYCSTEIAITFLIYKVYRTQGIHNFNWRIEEGEED